MNDLVALLGAFYRCIASYRPFRLLDHSLRVPMIPHFLYSNLSGMPSSIALRESFSVCWAIEFPGKSTLLLRALLIGCAPAVFRISLDSLSLAGSFLVRRLMRVTCRWTVGAVVSFRPCISSSSSSSSKFSEFMKARWWLRENASFYASFQPIYLFSYILLMRQTIVEKYYNICHQINKDSKSGEGKIHNHSADRTKKNHQIGNN